MFQNFHLPILAVILSLFLLHLHFLLNAVEAKQYEPYGDILEEEEEPNSFQNRYEPKNTPNRYEHRARQGFSNSYQPKTYGQRYQNEFQQEQQHQHQQHSNGRRRGEREKAQYEAMETTRLNTNNRNMGRGNIPNRWTSSARTLGEQQNDNMTAKYDGNHKCQIWVPSDALDKYPDAEPVQSNKISQSEYIEVCCPGYGAMRWLGKTLCRPLCENCQNGRCVEPGKCECYDEFIANDNGDCVFTCPLGCLNGRCYLDGSCQCDPGYKLDKSRKFCRPICSKGCGISPLLNCTEPEVCGCIKGYILTDTGCRATCQPECGIGGNCSEPNVCNCHAGYELKDGVCQSDCYQKCDNGYCYNRNRCICKPGFTYHERSTQCVPK